MAKKDDAPEAASQPLTCGVVMPISAIDGCTSDHWSEVKGIIFEAVESIQNPTFSVKLVSDADDVGVIQKRIVQNIYNSNIVVCDVSGKNPNVMFELGMRLAFDKPTVIIKDDKTDYAFDTGIIEHIPYPRDLRFARIVTFKQALVQKILATHRESANNADHSTFLKNFGQFQVATLSEAVVPADKIVIEMLQELQSEMSQLRRFSQIESRRISNADSIDGLLEGIINKQIESNPNFKVSDLLGGSQKLAQSLLLRLPKSLNASLEDCENSLERVLLRLYLKEKIRDNNKLSG